MMVGTISRGMAVATATTAVAAGVAVVTTGATAAAAKGAVTTATSNITIKVDVIITSINTTINIEVAEVVSAVDRLSQKIELQNAVRSGFLHPLQRRSSRRTAKWSAPIIWGSRFKFNH